MYVVGQYIHTYRGVGVGVGVGGGLDMSLAPLMSVRPSAPHLKLPSDKELAQRGCINIGT